MCYNKMSLNLYKQHSINTSRFHWDLISALQIYYLLVSWRLSNIGTARCASLEINFNFQCAEERCFKNFWQLNFLKCHGIDVSLWKLQGLRKAVPLCSLRVWAVLKGIARVIEQESSVHASQPGPSLCLLCRGVSTAVLVLSAWS